jgi:hypothetical protein
MSIVQTVIPTKIEIRLAISERSAARNSRIGNENPVLGYKKVGHSIGDPPQPAWQHGCLAILHKSIRSSHQNENDLPETQNHVATRYP